MCTGNQELSRKLHPKLHKSGGDIKRREEVKNWNRCMNGRSTGRLVLEDAPVVPSFVINFPPKPHAGHYVTPSLHWPNETDYSSFKRVFGESWRYHWATNQEENIALKGKDNRLWTGSQTLREIEFPIIKFINDEAKHESEKDSEYEVIFCCDYKFYRQHKYCKGKYEALGRESKEERKG